MRARARAGRLVLALLAAACTGGAGGGNTAARDSAAAPAAGHFGLGREATVAEVAALDIDVAPTGAGLPAGRGTVAAGERLYRAQCAICHGASGEGIPPNPPLIGAEPRQGFPFASDFRIAHTIGNYWPYATTLYDYVRRAMPQASPGILTADETYSVTAYLLSANGILPPGASLDSATLVGVRMPARDHFVRDDRRGGREVR